MATVQSRSPAGVTGPGRAAIAARQLRTDRWWLAPAVTVVALAAFVVYATWRAFTNTDYYAAPYVSPFYSPCLSENCVEMQGGPNWAVLGDWWVLSPALIFLALPLGFRLTCYYYRKAYYRAFWASPPACAVAEPHQRNTGETRFPLIVNNVHRYFFYAALPIAVILTYDTVLGFRNAEYEWGHMGLGTLIFLVNIVLVWGYTLSCHSCRHIMGGRLRHFSAHPVRYRLWTWTSRLNGRHMELAWGSLFSLALADLYVYLLATGVFDDPVLF
ncbi:hypothetical protein [Streptomyces aidingensis]|uniref:Integral membrane protein n=1 Tax=Streptomyces aidingensis TaxID=910347 RepID=A0A1I1EST9_9ACTN|nr:hypothetical protein [Streptomyces aidingensis]SFB90184.1 hypothetical protein SAMN05421773_101449 [Streptomyces aidingensis]